MASSSGRRGQLVPPEEREAFLKSLEKWKDDDSLCSTQDSVQEGQDNGNNSSAPIVKLEEGCRICGKDDDHNNLMYCDDCHFQYHTYCVGLQAVPPGDWFCSHCKPYRRYSGDGLDEKVGALPPSYTERFGEIVWAQGGAGYGWWPSYIYDPSHTVGSARKLAHRNLGRKHLVFFLECTTTPFGALGESGLVKWENGFAENFHLGKMAHAHSKARGMAFRQALRIASLEQGKPVEKRMARNHLGDDVPLDEHVPMSSVRVRRKQRPSSNDKQEKESNVSKKPTKRQRKGGAKKEPSTRASTSRANLVHAATIVAGTPVRRKTPSNYYYTVFKRVRDESDHEVDERLGFIRLESLNSTFLDARAAIQEDMDPETLPGEMWKFNLPSLGVVSNRQERSLGPVASFLQGTFGGHFGDGSVENPFHLVIVADPRTHS